MRITFGIYLDDICVVVYLILMMQEYDVKYGSHYSLKPFVSAQGNARWPHGFFAIEIGPLPMPAKVHH